MIPRMEKIQLQTRTKLICCLCFVFLCILSFPSLSLAYFFPTDSISLFFNDPPDNTKLLASSSAYRTLNYLTANCASASGLPSIVVATTTTDYTLLKIPSDLLSSGDKSIYTFLNYKIPKYGTMYFRENASTNCFISIVYTPYDLSIISTSTIATTTLDITLGSTTVSLLASTSPVQSEDIYAFTVLLITIAVVLVLDFVRRLFSGNIH